jgi:hypothetical protein
VAASGASAPTPCAAGTFQSGTGVAACTACATGTLQPATGQAVCVPIPKAVSSVVYDPANLQNLYTGIDNAGVYLSTNGGSTWTPATTQPTSNRVKAVVLTPGDGTRLFAATYGGGVFVSANSGIDWSSCTNTGLTNLNLLSLTIDNTGRLYAGSEAGVFVSGDGCGTWAAINSGLPN